MSDVLGFGRFAEHRDWRCSGHIDGEIDPADRRVFTVERRGDRWLLTADHELVVVGDAHRDLLAEDGGLARHPATRGFATYQAAALARRIGTFGEFGSWEVTGDTTAEHAGRPARDVTLRHTPYEVTLGIDAETGIWTWLHIPGLSIVVDELTVAPIDVAAEFALLDFVPELDLSDRMTPSEALTPVIQALHTASGLELEVIYEDVETGAFRLILLGPEGDPRGLISRTHGASPLAPAVFGGLQDRQDSADEWGFHIDTASSDPLWLGRMVTALDRLYPTEV